MYACMHVCVYMYTYVCVHVCMCTCMHVYIYIHTYTYVCRCALRSFSFLLWEPRPCIPYAELWKSPPYLLPQLASHRANTWASGAAADTQLQACLKQGLFKGACLTTEAEKCIAGVVCKEGATRAAGKWVRMG